MYVCLCRGVNDQTVRATVAAGATSINEVVAVCGAGSRCGGCLPSLRHLLRDSLADDRDTRLTSRRHGQASTA